MNKDLDAWKTRLDNRKKLAQKEIEKRTKILAEVSILFYGKCKWGDVDFTTQMYNRLIF